MEEGKPEGNKVNRIASQYADSYPWADREALKLYFLLELVNDSLREVANSVHTSILPGARGWLVAVLRALYVSPGRRLSHAEIGSETRVPAANVTYQVDVLEAGGYVARVPHESDRRITLVELTPKGEELCEKIIPARARFITDLGQTFTEEEKKTLNDLLERLQAAVDSYSPLE